MLNKKRLWIIINIILVIVWCAVIFYLSAQTAKLSDGQSKFIAGFIARTIDKVDFKITPESILINQIHSFNAVIRDLAHAFSYLVLALLTVNLGRQLKIKKWKTITFAFIFCSLYAYSDEIYQLFVPGRAFQLSDLRNDILGAITGIIIYFLVVFLKRKIFSKRVTG